MLDCVAGADGRDAGESLRGPGELRQHRREQRGELTAVELPQPGLVTGGEMRPYPLVGVHWLVGLYENGLNGILGNKVR